jgi:hypothetical protein
VCLCLCVDLTAICCVCATAVCGMSVGSSWICCVHCSALSMGCINQVVGVTNERKYYWEFVQWGLCCNSNTVLLLSWLYPVLPWQYWGGEERHVCIRDAQYAVRGT